MFGCYSTWLGKHNDSKCKQGISNKSNQNQKVKGDIAIFFQCT